MEADDFLLSQQREFLMDKPVGVALHGEARHGTNRWTTEATGEGVLAGSDCLTSEIREVSPDWRDRRASTLSAPKLCSAATRRRHRPLQGQAHASEHRDGFMHTNIVALYCFGLALQTRCRRRVAAGARACGLRVEARISELATPLGSRTSAVDTLHTPSLYDVRWSIYSSMSGLPRGALPTACRIRNSLCW